MRYLFATIALACALLLGGCGQMGPLYEPVESEPLPETENAES